MGFLSLSSLKSQVSKPYFPVVIFALATANTFAVFLSGLVTTLFVSTCVAVGKKRFAFVALCNALGATCGFALFVALLEARGTDWFRERYPEVFASKHWARGEEVVADLGGRASQGSAQLSVSAAPARGARGTGGDEEARAPLRAVPREAHQVPRLRVGRHHLAGGAAAAQGGDEKRK